MKIWPAVERTTDFEMSGFKIRLWLRGPDLEPHLALSLMSGINGGPFREILGSADSPTQRGAMAAEWLAENIKNVAAVQVQWRDTVDDKGIVIYTEWP